MKSGSKAKVKKVKHEWGKNRMFVADVAENFDHTHFFAVDTLISYEFHEAMKNKLALEPEKQLMLAVLEDAVCCFKKYINSSSWRGRTLFLDADAWIQEKDTVYLFSFESVCEHLGFDADYVREGLNRWKKQNQRLVEIQVPRRERRGRKPCNSTILEIAVA